MAIKQVTAYQLSDGSLELIKERAEKLEKCINFRRWCNDNICVGGEWSAIMVANAILDSWDVREEPF